ncbi:glycoside hydrolase 100 family protein [Geobacter sp. DSM 9736]|uniref:glycoside hydrolase 100 family protein n=1 Tax=Geobacter sp. DSM 9736 TaxID=1277350 RepID=UPI000B506FC0|nr:glycoside hydrolase 100 family protein [Geobacter sp. DSM 9736]SNB47350.1 Alkaline and neutral invertase [Geobacter sp. DSM 9736]
MNNPASTDIRLIEEAYRRSVELLRMNSTPAGILAASPGSRAHRRNYTCIFGRDAAICALGMAASGEPDLIECARAGLMTLGNHQAPNGQIPKFVRPEDGEADFWYTGCIDATIWWLIALHVCDRIAPGIPLREELANPAAAAIQWLSCQEHQSWRLLQQNEASDWADIMPRSGFVLYTNVLWRWLKRLVDDPSASDTHRSANHLLHPFATHLPDERRMRLLVHYTRRNRRPTPFYLSFVNLSVCGTEQDILGNILAGLTGLADTSRAAAIARSIIAMQADTPFPVRVVGSPLTVGHPLWRTYMQRHRQNLPWNYHNGGIWPFAGGFLVLLLDRLGMSRAAWHCLEGLARASSLNGWEFNEWLHGRTGEALGMPGQSWNAALYILAYQALCNSRRFLP